MHKKAARESDSERRFAGTICPHVAGRARLTLTCLEARLGLVDDISPATATNHAVIAVTTLEGLERINDFHRIYPSF
jgi:hypothetical protein